jgi:CBS domain-containing protein/sporulation protein YlmC with PRC-barrel domain
MINHTALNHTAVKTAPEQVFFLSQILGAKVIAGGKKVGSLKDIVIKENGTLPVATHFFVALPFGESALVPWDRIEKVSAKEIVVAADNITGLRGEPGEGAVLLRDHILDKKAIDLDGREVEVVYDIKLVLRNNRLYVSDVDLSRYGLLRRMGLTWLANSIYDLAESIRDQSVSWKYIQPLPEKIGSFQGNVKLNVLKEKLADMHPVDLADILEELDPDQRVELFEKLDPEQASDTLEEIDPNTQRDLVESLKIEKVAQLIDEMTTGQSADVLSVLSASEAEAILQLLNPENTRKIRAIMQQHEENILDFATQDYIALSPELTVEQAQDEYRAVAKGKDVVMYLYVVDRNGRLAGVLDIKELLQADEKARLKDVMVDNIIALDHDSTLRQAAELFARYGFRALPITDDVDRIVGVVTYRDIMGLKHNYVE